MGVGTDVRAGGGVRPEGRGEGGRWRQASPRGGSGREGGAGRGEAGWLGRSRSAGWGREKGRVGMQRVRGVGRGETRRHGRHLRVEGPWAVSYSGQRGVGSGSDMGPLNLCFHLHGRSANCACSLLLLRWRHSLRPNCLAALVQLTLAGGRFLVR